jgi:hypothetical protein
LALGGCSASEGEGEPTAGQATSTDGGASEDSGASAAPTTPADGPADGTAADTNAASSGDDDAGESTGAAEVRVPMFVAQGMLGRTTISCDDGHTWVADRAWDEEGDALLCGSTEPVRCWESACQFFSGGECQAQATECDCGHHPGFSKGVAFGADAFVATWGWGYSGSVRRSVDGVHWEETLADDVTFGGLAYGAGRFVLSSRNPRYSADGVTWTAGQEANFQGPDGEITWSVRRFVFADYDTGRFIATADPPHSVLVSSDGGETWWPPSFRPPQCLLDQSTYGGMAYGNGVVVSIGSDGTACRSTDGGDNWELGSVGGDNVLGHVVWTGREFAVWAPGMRYTSPDGVQWTGTPTVPEGVWLGPVAMSEATGTFVAVSRVWDGYEQQSFLRSEDGITWEPLGEGAFSGGHPIFHIAFGYGEPSDVCPAPG